LCSSFPACRVEEGRSFYAADEPAHKACPPVSPLFFRKCGDASAWKQTEIALFRGGLNFSPVFSPVIRSSARKPLK
jgi:hypothetical protein